MSRKIKINYELKIFVRYFSIKEVHNFKLKSSIRGNLNQHLVVLLPIVVAFMDEHVMLWYFYIDVAPKDFNLWRTDLICDPSKVGTMGSPVIFILDHFHQSKSP